MTEQVNVTTERVDDIPLVLAHSDQMGVPELLDNYFKPHGNWEGMSLGWTTAIWLTHIVSEGDHRMNQVPGWAAQRVQTLSMCSGQEVSERSFRDDRLALVLDALSDEQKWQQCESALNRQLIRVYDLKPKRVRVESPTVSGYWTVTEEGLFQLGYSKDHRPDLPQLKVMLSALDPLGLPVATQVVSGERADDRLYLPAIAQVSQSLNTHGLLYVGDCKMAALETRAYLEAQQDYYLCPLAAKQMPDEDLQPVWTGEQALTAVWREREGGKAEQIAEGYERRVTLSREVAGKTIRWTERQLIVRSYKLAQAATQALHARLAKAQAELEGLPEHKQGKKRYPDGAALQQAVLAYREEYLVEHGFGRLKGQPLSLSPMYVQSDQRATGLVRLLSIGLRVLTLLEFRVRQRLADTQRPTAEALWGAFQGIHLSLVTLGQQLHRHLTPLSALHRHILSLLDFSSDLYDQLLC